MACDEAGLCEIKIEANNIAPSTLVAWARGRRGASAKNEVDTHREMRRDLDQRLRRAVLAHPALDISKQLVNRVISRAGLGDTLVACLQNRDGSTLEPRPVEEHSRSH
jgi:hypothetical protein